MLTAGCRIIGIGILFHPSVDLLKLVIQREVLQCKAFDNLRKAAFDLLKCLGIILSVFCLFFHFIEKVGDLGISGKALSGCRRDHISSFPVRTDNISNLFKLLSIGERTPSKFHYFHLYNLGVSYFVKIRPQLYRTACSQDLSTQKSLFHTSQIYGNGMKAFLSHIL